MKRSSGKKIFFSLWVLFLWVSLGRAEGPPEFAPDRILVKFKSGADEAQIKAKHGGREIHRISAIRVSVIETPFPVEEAVKRFRGEAKVEFAEFDYKVYAILEPGDPSFPQQWGLNNAGQTGGSSDADIDAPEAWDKTQGDGGVKIAILDTGIDQDHVDLASKIIANMNFTASPSVDDLYGHGTHVAGIAAAITNNGIGVAGVGFNSSLVNVKVLGDDGSGFWSWVANGITRATDNGAKVINMSLGSSFGSKTVENAIKYAWGKGVVLTAAAGNSGSSSRTFPAAYANCIAVAATDHKDAKPSWSNWHKGWVDVAAPGVNILSTLPNHEDTLQKVYDPNNTGYGSLSGTSMSAPHVAGVAALVFAAFPGADNGKVRARIENNADKIAGTGFYWAYGRINAHKAVTNPQ